MVRVSLSFANFFSTIIDNFVVGLNVLDDAQEKEEWVLTKIRSLVTRAGNRDVYAVVSPFATHAPCRTCCMDLT